MWVVEFTLHHLDLMVGLPGWPPPGPHCLDLAAATLDGLFGATRPPAWDLLTYLRKGSGRQPLDDADRAMLGAQASRYPAFG
jgi:hypothetical protein